MQSDSHLQRLARLALKKDPVEWVGHLRDAGMTWAQIADEMSTRIDAPISRETVRLWATQRDEATS